MAFDRESVQNQNQYPSLSVSPGAGGVLNLRSPQQRQPNPTFAPRNHEADTCFRCQKQGHWAKDCPNRTPKKPTAAVPEPPSPQSVLEIDGSKYSPSLICPCGVGTCRLLISATDKNPGRKFYSCPANCGFFKWFDAVTPDQITNVPLCPCGAKPCRVSTQITGPNAGRKFFVCPIRKGQGACDFFQWLDAQEMTSSGRAHERFSSPQSTDQLQMAPANSNLVDEGCINHERMEIELNAVDTPQRPQNHRAISGQSKRGKITLVEFEELEDTPNKPCRKHYKRLRHGGQKNDGSALDSRTECVNMSYAKPRDPLIEEELQASVLSEAEIHSRQVKFCMQISLEGLTLPASSASLYSCSSALPINSLPLKENRLVAAATSHNLGLNVLDWWGRLVFTPSRGLIMPQPRPFFCCVFPSFDPIFTIRNVDTINGEALGISLENPLTDESDKLSPLSLGKDDQLSSIVHWKPSSLNSLPEMVQCNIMSGTILEGFAQLAVHIQNKLLTVLESMKFHDHQSMVREASATFDALDRLSIDYRPFSKRVKEFIRCASSLAEIEWSISNDRSSQELVDRLNCEKKWLDDMSRARAEVMVGLEASKERLRLLGKEVSRVKDILFEIETDFSCCEAENQDLETRLVQISNDVVEYEQSFQAAFEAAEEALKLCQQRREEQHAAMVAFKKARMLLRD